MLADSAMLRCALAVRNCVGSAEPGPDDGGAEEGELPKWCHVPKYCRFRTEKLGAGGGRRPTEEEKRKQCREYVKFRNWALQVCGLTEPELEALLKSADFTPQDQLGAANLPLATRRPHRVGGERLSRRNHAALLCRVAGLLKAAARVGVEGLGGPEAMQRLLSLDSGQLQAECAAVPYHSRRAGSSGRTCSRNTRSPRPAAMRLRLGWT